MLALASFILLKDMGRGAEEITMSEFIQRLDNGEVAGIGTHDELMKNSGVYREIALSQLSKEELVR